VFNCWSTVRGKNCCLSSPKELASGRESRLSYVPYFIRSLFIKKKSSTHDVHGVSFPRCLLHIPAKGTRKKLTQCEFQCTSQRL
jgi:hypothetical protein